MIEDNIKPTLKELGIKNIHPLHTEPTPNEMTFDFFKKELRELNKELDECLNSEEEE